MKPFTYPLWIPAVVNYSLDIDFIILYQIEDRIWENRCDHSVPIQVNRMSAGKQFQSIDVSH